MTVAVLAYAHLWVLEGAFRKWVPGLDDPFYVARDLLLVALLAIAAVVAPSRERRSQGVLFWLCASVLAGLVAVQTITAAIPPLLGPIGLRGFLGPALMAYIAFRYPINGIWRRIARTLVVYSPIEAALTVLQVNSPMQATVNLVMGGEEVGFVTANGVVRATGTFTAPSGLSVYAPLALACAIALFLTAESALDRRLGFLGLASVVTIVALGGSRGAVVTSVVVLAFGIAHGLISRVPRRSGRAMALALSTVLVAGVAVTAFPEVIAAFGQRVETASEQENILQRVLTFSRFAGSLSSPAGDGIGSHSNIGAAFGVNLGWVESENARWVAELGVVGLALVLARLGLSVGLFVVAVRRIRVASPMFTLSAVLLAQVLLTGSMTTTPSYQGQVGLLAYLAASTFRAQMPPRFVDVDESRNSSVQARTVGGPRMRRTGTHAENGSDPTTRVRRGRSVSRRYSAGG